MTQSSSHAQAMRKRAQAFSQRLQQDFSRAPDPRSVLDAEGDLGTQSIAYVLAPKGRRLLFRALELERKARRRAARTPDPQDI